MVYYILNPFAIFTGNRPNMQRIRALPIGLFFGFLAFSTEALPHPEAVHLETVKESRLNASFPNRVPPRPDAIGTSRPIIGIVAQTTYGKRRRHGPSYFAASYVKYLEAAGARVVPVKINQTEEYYRVRQR